MQRTVLVYHPMQYSCFFAWKVGIPIPTRNHRHPAYVLHVAAIYESCTSCGGVVQTQDPSIWYRAMVWPTMPAVAEGSAASFIVPIALQIMMSNSKCIRPHREQLSTHRHTASPMLVMLIANSDAGRTESAKHAVMLCRRQKSALHLQTVIQ